MKRSEINGILKENIEFIKSQNFSLPPFAWFTPDEWKGKGHEYDEIRDHMLGWDITDYGKGDFEKIGLFLFTIRNGKLGDPWSEVQVLSPAIPPANEPYDFPLPLPPHAGQRTSSYTKYRQNTTVPPTHP